MINELVTAMGLVPPRLGARLILGGKAGSEKLMKEITRLPAWNLVQYIGKIPLNEMAALLATAAISVVLYSPSPNHLNIRSNRFFESLSAGLPVITSDFPDWHRMVEENKIGIAVDPRDPKAIASAIEYLLVHPDEAAQMGKRGLKLIREKFNWDKESTKLLSLYEQLS
jgi:glycosyltransferase involved in cell wall biosynthesis